jgi:hypothetical protein
MLCKLGLHRWQRRPTRRPGTAVYRCTSCNRRITLHRDRRRLQKRYAALGIICVSLVGWFVIINVARTGHTRVFHTTGKVVSKLDRAGSKVRGEIHRLEGDEGYAPPQKK